MPKQPYFHRVPNWVLIDRALREAATQIGEEQGVSPAVAYQCAVKAALIDVAYDLRGSLDGIRDQIKEVHK